MLSSELLSCTPNPREKTVLGGAGATSTPYVATALSSCNHPFSFLTRNVQSALTRKYSLDLVVELEPWRGSVMNRAIIASIQ